MIDTYQAATEMTDESGQSYPKNISALLNLANGPQGYYGVFTDNAHTDNASSTVADNVISTAQLYNNPVVSGRQMLGWLDYRDNSSFGSLSWNATTKTLSFTITTADNASGLPAGSLQAMVPLLCGRHQQRLTGITQNGSAVAFTTQRIKGVDYAFFSAATGSYTAQYAPDTQPPTVVSQSPASNATGVAANAAVTATFSEDMDPATISTSTFTLTGPSGSVPATVTYDTASKTATLTPTSGSGLAFNSAYTVTISGAQDVSHNAIDSRDLVVHHRQYGGIHQHLELPPVIARREPRPRCEWGRVGGQVPLRRRRLPSPASASTRATATPAPTSATSGAAPAPSWPPPPSPARRPRAGSRSTSPARWRSAPTPPTSPPTTPPMATTPSLRAYFAGSGVNTWPLHALADGEDGRTASISTAPTAFPTNSYLGPTTGSTSSSPRAARARRRRSPRPRRRRTRRTWPPPRPSPPPSTRR